jgi:ATP-binding cassette, subfamily B, bacterial
VMKEERARQQQPLLISMLVTSLFVSAPLLLLGWEAGTGRLELGMVALVIQALAAAARPLGEIETANAGLILVFTQQSLSLVSAAEERLADTPRILSGTRPATDLARREIRFEEVSFRYPGQEHEVLRNLDLVVPAGHSLAIVGSNGAGKTTLIKLLCRLYEPTAGRITVDGIDLREVDPSAWQRRIAAIFQDYVKYPLSAFVNVTFGGLHVAQDPSLLNRTANLVGITDLIERLPQGWETVLSRDYETGIDLSGGEWQRVALARALFAAGAGASVLILDEPTASLDVRGEAEIYDHFLDLTAGLTTLLISHRFSTVRRAERICVLEGGRIIEHGDHVSLLEENGRYAELFHLQASRFADEARLGAEESPEMMS